VGKDHLIDSSRNIIDFEDHEAKRKKQTCIDLSVNLIRVFEDIQLSQRKSFTATQNVQILRSALSI